MGPEGCAMGTWCQVSLEDGACLHSPVWAVGVHHPTLACLPWDCVLCAGRSRLCLSTPVSHEPAWKLAGLTEQWGRVEERPRSRSSWGAPWGPGLL